MAPTPDPVVSDSTLPDKTDVVIIGGGIIGLATALELAERRFRVVVCEKGIIAGEQSSRNWGWCRKMGRDSREIPLAKLSLDLWRGLNKRTQQETGFRQAGILYLCKTNRELSKYEHWLNDSAKPHALSSRLLTPDQTDAIAPGSKTSWKGALYTEDDGRAEPQKATAGIALAAQKLGVKIFTNCAVRGIEKTNGKISAVVTEKGRIQCDATVLAGGAWSRKFCTNAGIELPQLTILNSVMRSFPLNTAISHSMAGNKFAIRKRLDGGYTIAHGTLSITDIVPDSFRLFRAFLPSLVKEHKYLKFRMGRKFLSEARLPRSWNLDQVSPFELVRILNPAPSQKLLDTAEKSLIASFPEFENIKIKEQWGGTIDVTPDAVPVISAVDSVPGFFISSGFSGHGFGIGPAAGKLTADLISGDPPCVDPSPFRYARF